jgi:hypothetical protein
MADKSPKMRVVRQAVGVLTDGSSEPLPVVSVLASEDDKLVRVISSRGMSQDFKVSKLNISQVSGRIMFVSNRISYNIREPRETDGQWLSVYNVDLPLEAVETLVAGDTSMDDESIVAYADGDSPYVLGVIYQNEGIRWVRYDGDWLLVAEDDDTYDGMERMLISPERTEEFLDLYDHNYVTVSDAQQYESAEFSEAPADENDSD